MQQNYFFEQTDQFWIPYAKAKHRIFQQTLFHEGTINGKNLDQDPQTYFYQIYQDHIIKYQSYKEYMNNPSNAKTTSQVLFTDQLYLEIYELTPNININESMKYSLLLHQDNNKHFLCSQSKNEMLVWYQKLRMVCISSHFNNLYSIQDKLGEGAFAQVFKIKRKVDDKLFAAKIFSKPFVEQHKNSSQLKKAILNEMKIQRLIQNKNLAQLYEVYETNDQIILVLDLYTGKTLLDVIIKQNSLKENVAAGLFKQILQQLQYIHENRIIHRDLKPENLIFIEKTSKQLRIIDFGLSESVYDSYKTYKRCGTPGYVAPEILKNKTYGTKSDLFSAGVILYLLLSGSQPFYGKDTNEIIEKNYHAKVIYDFPIFGKKTSNEAIDLMKNLMTKQPDKRITAAQALRHPWFNKFQENENQLDNSSDRLLLEITNKYLKPEQIRHQRTYSKNQQINNIKQDNSTIVYQQYQQIQQSPKYQQQKQHISQQLQDVNGNIDSIETNDESPLKPRIFLKKIQPFQVDLL